MGNNDLQNRREFFKKAAKGALPILGAIVLANMPSVMNAVTAEPMGCKEACRTTCYGSCEGTCARGCTGGCKRGCTNCTATCSNSCTYQTRA